MVWELGVRAFLGLRVGFVMPSSVLLFRRMKVYGVRRPIATSAQDVDQSR